MINAHSLILVDESWDDLLLLGLRCEFVGHSSVAAEDCVSICVGSCHMNNDSKPEFISTRKSQEHNVQCYNENIKCKRSE